MTKKILTLAALVVAAPIAFAQMTPVGLWKSVDDKTGKERSLVRITDNAGTLSGKIEKRLDPAAVAGAVCDKCEDDRKGKPIDGMEIIRGAKKDGDSWSGGTILNPEEGKIYRLRLTPEDGGKKLEVRGFVGPFFRNQSWIRVE
jgi:uncharacterized protein (DUF2147 family)